MGERRLTERQQQFVEAYVASGNAMQAAREAGYAKPDPEGARLLGNARVSNAVRAMLGKRRRAAIMSMDEVHELWSKVARGKEKGADMGHRLKASELLARVNGEFASVAIVPPAGAGAAIVTPGADGEPPVITVYMPGNGRDAGR